MLPLVLLVLLSQLPLLVVDAVATDAAVAGIVVVFANSLDAEVQVAEFDDFVLAVGIVVAIVVQ